MSVAVKAPIYHWEREKGRGDLWPAIKREHHPQVSRYIWINVAPYGEERDQRTSVTNLAGRGSFELSPSSVLAAVWSGECAVASVQLAQCDWRPMPVPLRPHESKERILKLDSTSPLCSWSRDESVRWRSRAAASASRRPKAAFLNMNSPSESRFRDAFFFWMTQASHHGDDPEWGNPTWLKLLCFGSLICCDAACSLWLEKLILLLGEASSCRKPDARWWSFRRKL